MTTGEIWIGKEVVNDLAPRERDIAMVFQNYALYPHMTVRQNMGFALRLAKMAKSEVDQGVRDAAIALERAERSAARASAMTRRDQRSSTSRMSVRLRTVDPSWTPTLQGRRDGAFGRADILAPIHRGG